MSHRLYVDFNNRDENGKIRINTVGSLRDIELLKSELRSGVNVTLYDEELEFQARLERDELFNIWLGVVDWSTRREKGNS